MSNILITGASSDIGVEIIKLLDNPSNTIYAHYSSNIKNIEKLKSLQCKIIPICADFSSENGVNDLIKKVDTQDEILDQIVHLPAPKLKHIRFKDINWVNYESMLNIQVKSLFIILKKYLPIMSKEKRGKIVVILSSCTLNVPPSAMSHYVTTKYAQLGLIKSLAVEYASKNIQINALSPSMVETAYLSELPDIMLDLAAKNHPLKRNAQPKDIAPMVKVLLSEKSNYMNGLNIPITGGLIY